VMVNTRPTPNRSASTAPRGGPSSPKAVYNSVGGGRDTLRAPQSHYLGGSSVLGLVAALAVAGLLSADSLGLLPWVQSLLIKGLGAGSAMILLIASIGTNVSTLGPVAQVMGRRAAVLYAGSWRARYYALSPSTRKCFRLHSLDAAPPACGQARLPLPRRQCVLVGRR
jgi:hypothetical protein